MSLSVYAEKALSKLTIQTLSSIASKAEIRGYSKLKKNALVALLVPHWQNIKDICKEEIEKMMEKKSQSAGLKSLRTATTYKMRNYAAHSKSLHYVQVTVREKTQTHGLDDGGEPHLPRYQIVIYNASVIESSKDQVTCQFAGAEQPFTMFYTPSTYIGQGRYTKPCFKSAANRTLVTPFDDHESFNGLISFQ